MSEFIICNCNMVMSNEVDQYIREYPDMSASCIKRVLNIGTRCGGCLLEDSPIVEINIEEYVKKAKNIYYK